MDGHYHHRLVERQMLSGIQAAISAPSDTAPAQTTPPAESTREPVVSPVTTTTRAAPATTTTPPADTTTTPSTTSASPPATTSASPPADVTTKTTTTPPAETTTTTTPRAARTTSATQAPVVTTPSVINSGTASGETTIVVSTLTQSTSSSPSSSGTSLASNNGSSSNGPSTGAVVGIVAAALVGTVIVAALVGYLFRKKWGRREEEDSPFDKDEFRRASVMLDDDQYNGGFSGGHSPQMSEHSSYGMGVAGLGRANTVLPGLGRNGTLQTPRPPSSIVNHFQRQQAMAPSFQPGQIMPSYPPGPHAQFGGGGFHSPPPMDLYGGYPVPVNQQQQLNQNMYGQQPLYHSQNSYGQQQQHPGSGLERNISNASAYSQQDVSRGPSRAMSRNDGQGQQQRPLSLVHEDHESYRGGGAGSRSGTPVNAAVQQVYYSHGPNDSITSPRNLVPSNGRPHSPSESTLPGYEGFGEGQHQGQPRSRSPGMEKGARAQRTLSVRNGGLDSQGRPLSYASDDAYGGVF